MITYPRIKIPVDQSTADIKDDGRVDTPSEFIFSDLEDLRTGAITTAPVCTYEPDYWLLDGSFKFLNDPAAFGSDHVGYFARIQSNNLGVVPHIFDGPTYAVLTYQFSTVHSLVNLTLTFQEASGDYVNDLDIKYYNASNVLIQTDHYTPSGPVFSTGEAVADFKKIMIYFNKTNRPYRFVRLLKVEFSTTLVLERPDLLNAVLLEEINLLSTRAPISTLDLRVFSTTQEFDPINPRGDYGLLKQNMPVYAYEILGTQELFLGRYYLDDWKGLSPKQAQLECVDLLGFLEKQPYKGGVWLAADAYTLADLVDDLLTPLGVTYSIDASLTTAPIIGWLAISSVRQALQQACFACGCYMKSCRELDLKFIPTPLAADVTSEDIHLTEVDLSMDVGGFIQLPLVTGVQLTVHTLTKSTNVLNVLYTNLAAGTYEFKFYQPLHDLSVSGATISESGPNYAILTVAAPGTVTLNGQVYLDAKTVYEIAPELVPPPPPNILQVDTATLIHSGNAATIAQNLYDYAQQRLRTETLRAFPRVMVNGQAVLIDTNYGQRVMTYLERQEINLTGGFMSKIAATGVLH